MAKRFARKRSINAPAPSDAPQENRERLRRSPPENPDAVRTKGSGHGKKTADKWNQ